MFVKFSTLQEYGVDRVFFLENDNVDSSQKNVFFLARGEKASVVSAVAGMSTSGHQYNFFLFTWLFKVGYADQITNSA